MANILTFKQPMILLSAVCNTCEKAWTAEMPTWRYEKYLIKNTKHICPHCSNYDVSFARMYT